MSMWSVFTVAPGENSPGAFQHLFLRGSHREKFLVLRRRPEINPIASPSKHNIGADTAPTADDDTPHPTQDEN